MKKTFLYLFLSCSSLSFIACGDVPDNGDLDGMWHLRTVESLSDNQVKDVKEERVYYSIQQRLIVLRRAGYTPYIGRFTHTGDSLLLHDFVVYQREDSIATAIALTPFYLDGIISRYAVQELDNDEMTLRSSVYELTFKKF